VTGDSAREVNKFNLTFSGEIQAGQDPAQVRQRFGKLFAIDDPIRLERFFSGQTVILRRNLERKDAALYYHELQQLGVVAALVKVSDDVATDAGANTTSPLRKASGNVSAKRKTARHSLPQQPAPLDQSWAVSSTITNRKRDGETLPATAKSDVQDAPARQRPGKTDLTAKIRTRKQESQRQATAEQAAQQEQQRRVAEISARRAAEKKRREEQEAAKRQALAAEEAARREAERAQSKRRADEEAARKKVEKELAKRKAAEEAAQRKALKEQEKAERVRLKVAEAARRKAELKESKRHEAEEAARLQAELEELKRREAEEAARLEAELAEIKRLEAEEAARVKVEAQRREAEAQRQSAERRRVAAQQLAAQRALRKEERRRVAAERAEAVARQNAEQLRREQLERPAPSAALRRVPAPRAADAPAQAITLKPSKNRVRTNLEVPQRKPIPTAPGTPPPRKRQPGEPNLYTLRPFRNTGEVRARATQAPRRMRQAYTLGALVLAILLIAGSSFLHRSANVVITGAEAIVIDPDAGPLLLAGDRLLWHDRAGVSIRAVALSDFGASTLSPPLAIDGKGALLALGRLQGDSTQSAPQLLRCKLGPPQCAHFSPQLEGYTISTFVLHPLDGSLLLADSAAGALLKIDRAGQLVANAAVNLPAQPVLRLHGGLLWMNSADGPAIGVFRYEDNAFGQQLDEILLLPPSEQQTSQSRVGDFLWSSGAWWASLRNPESGSVGLYRFDEKWTYLDEVALPPATGPLQLVNWDEKTLVNDPLRPAALRFNAQRAAEAPFASKQLAALLDKQQRRATLSTAAWRVGLLLCALAALLGFGIGYLQKLRAQVYKAHREHGAEPVDDYVDTLQWIDPVQNRLALLRRKGVSYSLLVLGILLVAGALNVTVWQLAALLLVLSGPAIALLLLSRYPAGNIGVTQDQLLLVDHRGMYHLAGCSGVQYHGPFLLIDDVVVFSGSRLLPAFAPSQLRQLVIPLAMNGVKVDSKSIVVKLLQCRHPFALGVCAMLAASAAAALLLSVQGIF